MTEVVQLKGGKELARTLDAAGDALADFGRAAAAGSTVIANGARGGIRSRSGRLARSVSPGVDAGGVAVIRVTAPYAGPIEGGWRARNISPRRYLWGAGVRDTATAWHGAYMRQLEDILATVKGA